MNNVSLVGHLTKKPELRYTTNNQTPVAKFTIAVRKRFPKEGQPNADFLPIVVWGKPAENCNNYLEKGSLVSVTGSIETRYWDDQEGKRHFITEIIADDVQFLSKGSDTGQKSQEHQTAGAAADETGEDGLPF